MAVLGESDRVFTWARWMDDNEEDIAITKQQLRAAIDTTDVWIQDNLVSFNSSLPQAAKDNLTQNQKVMLFLYVLAKRFDIGI